MQKKFGSKLEKKRKIKNRKNRRDIKINLWK